MKITHNNQPRPPCQGCKHELESKRGEPCASCLLPGQYDDALNQTHFPTVKFLRHSKPNHYGKEKKEMSPTGFSIKKYCDEQGVSVDDVLSSSRNPKLAAARKNIAQAMKNVEGVDYKTIAAKLKMSHSTIWNYLNTRPAKTSIKATGKQMILDFKDCPEIYARIVVMAEQELREPENQALWILMNTGILS